MISLFRNFFQSKIGLPIFIGFLVVVALAFASADISGSSTFGGLTGDDKVAVVGGESITSNEISGAMNNALTRARGQNPTITMPQFIEQGGLENELELYIDRYATGLFAKDHGLRAGDNLVNSEILQIAAFRNLTGEFDEATYRAALSRQGITDAILRRDIRDGLLAQQVLRPAFAAPQMPEAAARQYAALVLERRQGRIGLIPSTQYAPEGEPSDEDLAVFYSENRNNYVLPERRTIRFAAFDAQSVTEDLTPSDEQIAAFYEQNADTYDALEERAISSFVVPTEAAAQALIDRINGGISLEAAANEAGFQVSSAEMRDFEAVSSSFSFALAEAAFAAEEGAIVGPARSALGWYVARIDDVRNTPARSLDEVRDEISARIIEDTRTAALIDLSSRIEEQVDTGTSLSDVATEFGLEVNVVADLTADGQVFGLPGQGVSPVLRPVLETAFQMEEGQPQLAEIVPGTQFMVFDVEDIVESAAPPLEEVRDVVALAWRLSEGSDAAREVADRILEQVRGGADLADAMREENTELNQIETIDLRRTELMALQGRGVPAPLVLLFSMATGSTKILEDANKVGWYVIDLDSIETDPLEDNPQVLAQTRETLTPALVNEYNSQLSKAVREEVGVERNEEAIEAVRKLLAGES